MGNLYGVSNQIPIWQIGTAGSDVSVSAGTETNVISITNTLPTTPGDYFPVLFCCLAILFGASLPTAMTVAFRLGAGADVDSLALAAGEFIASETHYYTVPLVGVNSGTTWATAAQTVNVTLNATGQAVTLKATGSRVIFGLIRGPDA